jgi:hypothetical protein
MAQEAAQPEVPAPAAAETTETTTTTTTSAQPAAVSPGIRIVRLSQVTGEVQLDRQTGNGFEGAFANLPIVQGGRLRTGEGVAEVEFEDNSSLRLTPHSLVEFPVLSANASGVHSSTIHVVEGSVYVSLTKNKDNNVNVTFGKETLALSPSSHIELALNGQQPRLDVLDGTVQAVNNTGTTTTVGKKKALLFDPANAGAPTLVSKNEKGPFADWDKRQVDYHNHFAQTSSNYAGTPYTYGLADMNYYGGFSSMGSCGMMWQPYLASANWSPFSNGAWAWYPGAGYSWVSPYPWGWTAFHSGSWNYCPGAGWGWRPSSAWNGLRNTAAVTLPGRVNGLKPPIARPHPLSPTIVAVNEKPLVSSNLNQNSFVFRKDSAGLGVPRGTFGKLNQISSGVAHRGSVEREVYIPSAANAPGGRQQNNPGRTAANQGNTNTAAHTMPTTGHTSMPTHSAPSGGSMGGGAHSAPGMSSGSVGGARGSMGGPAGGGAAGGGHASAGPHH